MQKKLLIVFSIMISFLMLGCESKQDPIVAETPAVPVIVSSAVTKDITLYLESIGTLKPSVLMEVRPQIEGTLIEVLAKEGQWVVPGTPLFKIDSKPYAIKVQEMMAQAEIDKTNLVAVQKKLARIRPLAQKDLVPQTEWEDLEAEAEKYQAAIALDQARLDNAKLDLEHCTMLSKASGRVGKLDAHPGLLVTRSKVEPLATISQMNPLVVEFTITEKEFPKIPKYLQEIEVKPLCSSATWMKGSITFLDNHFDPATGLLLVRGKIENSDDALRPGQSVKVRVPISIVSSAKFIPQKAVRYNQEGPYIYVVQPDHTVTMRQLVLGEEQEDEQIVLQGLDLSEQFIIDGHLRLSPGTKVDIKS